MPTCSFPRWALLVLALPVAAAEAPADRDLLDAAVKAWTARQADWAFTRRETTTNDKGAVKDERVETYDPSQPDSARWHLVSIDGHAPSPADLAKEEKKNRKPRKYGYQPPATLLDFSRAEVKEEQSDTVVYEVPVKPISGALAQTDKVVVLVTVNRRTRTVERLTAQLRSPMRIALGLARVTDMDMDLSFEGGPGNGASEPAPTGGTARATLATFGLRVTYEWSDFRAVHDASATPSP